MNALTAERTLLSSLQLNLTYARLTDLTFFFTFALEEDKNYLRFLG